MVSVTNTGIERLLLCFFVESLMLGEALLQGAASCSCSRAIYYTTKPEQSSPTTETTLRLIWTLNEDWQGKPG